MGATDYYTLNYFAEIPTDRLITGFLTVNVRKKDGGSASTHDWKKGLRKSPTNISPNSSQPTDPLGQGIGDYHCFLYWVVVGAHWHTHRMPTWDALYANGVPDHPHCQSFIRAYPVALINPDTGSLLNHKVITVDGQDGVVVSKLGNPQNGGVPESDDATGAGNKSFAKNWYWEDIASQFGVHNGIGSPYKQPTGTNLDSNLNHQFTEPQHGSYNGYSAGNSWSGFPDLAFNRQVDLSTNTYPRGNNTGLMPNYGNGIVDNSVSPIPATSDAHNNGDGVANDFTNFDDDTLKSPVKSVLIEGWHDFAWRDTGSDFAMVRHTPYCLRVQVKLNHDATESQNANGGASPQDNALGARNVSCNVMFQPFGETNNITFNNEPPNNLSTDGNPS